MVAYPPAKDLGAKGGQAGGRRFEMNYSPIAMIDCAVPCTVKARRWRSSANVKQQRSLLGFGISVHQCSSAVEENSLTRAQPPHPPRPLLPQPKPWGAKGGQAGGRL